MSLYDSLLENNQSSAETSYHVTGSVNIEGYPPSPLDLWAPAGEARVRAVVGRDAGR